MFYFDDCTHVVNLLFLLELSRPRPQGDHKGSPYHQGTRYCSTRTVPTPGRPQGIAPTMDEPDKPIRRHGRGDPLWSPCLGCCLRWCKWAGARPAATMRESPPHLFYS